jgi:hypothetical protein
MKIKLTRKILRLGITIARLKLKLKLAGICINGGTCVLIGQYTKNLTGIDICLN